MQRNTLFADERAISPVVGVALLIAIAVILATVIGAAVLNLGPGGASAPQVDTQADYNKTSGNLTVSHRGGDPLSQKQLKLIDEGGDTVELANLSDASLTDDGELTAGESFRVSDGSTDLNLGDENTPAQEITLVWESPNGEKEVIVETYSP